MGVDHVTRGAPPFCSAEAVFRAQRPGRRALPPGRSSGPLPPSPFPSLPRPAPSLALPAAGLRPVFPPPFPPRLRHFVTERCLRRTGAAAEPPASPPSPALTLSRSQRRLASPRPGPRSHVLQRQPRVRLFLRRDGRLGCHGLQR